MNQAQWVSSDDVVAMIDWLIGAGVDGPHGSPPLPCATDRKLRLFLAACCRLRWAELPAEHRAAVAVAERLADGELTPESDEARRAVRCKIAPSIWDARDLVVSSVDFKPANSLRVHEMVALTALDALRDIINPWLVESSGGMRQKIGGGGYRIDHGEKTQLLPLAVDVQALARYAYAERVTVACEKCFEGEVVFVPKGPARQVVMGRKCPCCRGTGCIATGHLDNGTLGALADMLEEAGCTDANLLAHLRSAGPHFRGCWTIDALTGRE